MNTKTPAYLLAFISAISAFLAFSTMDAIIRFLGPTIPALQLSFYQILFTVLIFPIPIIAMCLKEKSFAILRIHHPWSYLVRGVFVFFITICFVKTFVYLPLSNAYSMIFSLPLFTVLCGRIFIKEKISRLQFLCICIGFLGILIILRPGFGVISKGYFFALIGICLEAPLFIMVRHYHKKDHPLITSFYPTVIALVLFVIYSVISKNVFVVKFDATALPYLVALASFAVLSQIFLNFSLRYLQAGLSISMQFSQIIWGALYGYFLFHESAYDIPYFIGTSIIVLCSIAVTTNRVPFFHKKPTP